MNINKSVIDANLNNTECVQKISNFGETTVMNICSGSVSHVPWGSMDWSVFIGIGVLMAAVIGLFIFLFCAVVFDW